MSAPDLNKIKELRNITDAPFVDCKKALEASAYDIQKAIAWLQENGKAKAIKKAGRIAAEGLVYAIKNDKKIVIFELNSETDFVAKNKNFISLKDEIATLLLENNFNNLDQAFEIKSGSGKTISDLVTDASATLGEKISLRRVEFVLISNGQNAGSYVHFNGQTSAIAVIEGGSKEVARNVCMHSVAMNPEFTFESEIPVDKLNKIKSDLSQSPALVGKPENIQQSIITGMLAKELSKFVLEYQPFVVESEISVAKYLQNNNAKLIKIIRFEVGEGIEKVVSNFSEEVKNQIENSK
ncbi:translation elongation factor Ts [Mesomycoplasma bovoculi]|uniref:Elongation factor Ts n=1 Tax=Mesomycoplasma bovoculi M165/69 TaxID=743966 RepID=W5UT94_9BACT|nr:translation elongation factor Ts [Mesomycoplasma bovoculi]AHH45424.1 elongation factor Ts [Mesomycoplasma bovoculi M165/69]